MGGNGVPSLGTEPRNLPIHAIRVACVGAWLMIAAANHASHLTSFIC
jgi:hypothetical protein